VSGRADTCPPLDIPEQGWDWVVREKKPKAIEDLRATGAPVALPRQAIFALHARSSANATLTFYHPDYTVGPGFSPDPALRLAGSIYIIPPIGNWHLAIMDPCTSPCPEGFVEYFVVGVKYTLTAVLCQAIE